MEYFLLAGLGVVIVIVVYAKLTRQQGAVKDKTFSGNVESSGRVTHAIAQPMTNAPRVTAPTHADLENEVRALLAAGEKLQAVKLVRERTGLGLKEAKDYVDRL